MAETIKTNGDGKAAFDSAAFTREFRAAARLSGADLVGIAPIERFAGVPAEHHPLSIFPETRSVVVVGKRITRGTIRGVEEGTQFDTFQQYGYTWLENRFLAMATFKTSEFLEDNGWEAVPLPNVPSQIGPMGIPVRPGKPAPNVLMDFDDAAVRAGLGEIGYLDIFLSPAFGPRQRFQMILTDAVLEPDKILLECISLPDKRQKDFCPLHAIHTDHERILDICGKKMTVARVDYQKCGRCKNGALANRYHFEGRPDRLGALCVRSCIEDLEKNGRLSNRFRSPFRKRKAWTVTDNPAVLEEGSEIE